MKKIFRVLLDIANILCLFHLFIYALLLFSDSEWYLISPFNEIAIVIVFATPIFNIIIHILLLCFNKGAKNEV